MTFCNKCKTTDSSKFRNGRCIDCDKYHCKMCKTSDIESFNERNKSTCINCCNKRLLAKRLTFKISPEMEEWCNKVGMNYGDLCKAKNAKKTQLSNKNNQSIGYVDSGIPVDNGVETKQEAKIAALSSSNKALLKSYGDLEENYKELEKDFAELENLTWQMLAYFKNKFNINIKDVITTDPTNVKEEIENMMIDEIGNGNNNYTQ